MLLKRCFFVWLLLVAGRSYGRQPQPPSLEASLQLGIQRAYPASVRAWGYDTVRQQQNGAQFSAVVVSPEGYMLTVAHAIQPNRTYKLSFPDGREAVAVGLGRIDLAASRTMPDVAVMKILGKGPWPYVEMGSSGKLEKGDPCFSIGYPESLSQSLPDVRFGYIVAPQLESGFVHSSCAMEVGDSGGPLFDLTGRVVALNSRCDSSEDVNYHVPVDLYRKHWTALTKAENYTEYPIVDEGVGVVEEVARAMYTPAGDAAAISTAASVLLQSQVSGKLQAIGGTAVALPGMGTYIISKSSCVGNAPVVVRGGRSSLPATVVARSKEQDLVLLHVQEKIKGALPVADTGYALPSPGTGSFVYAVLPGGRQVRGVTGSRVFALPAKFSSGYFGANATWVDGAASLSRITPNSPVAMAGLVEKDKILRIAGQPVNKPADYGAILLQFFPHDTIVLDIKRGDSSFQQAIVLGVKQERKSSHPADHFAGGKSERRDGFPSVWLCDARIPAADCGAPVYDASGKFCGIVISRFSRTAALVIPPAVINSWIVSTFK